MQTEPYAGHFGSETVATIALPAATFETFEDRPAWLEGRRTRGIGSSDAAAILGVSRFKSPLALYYEKLGVQQKNPRAQELRDWGHVLEEPIAQRYAHDTSRTVAKPPAFSIARSTTYPFALASVDRFVVGHQQVEGRPFKPFPAPGLGVVEVKNAHLFMADEWSEENNNEPPIEYQIQLQHQLMVTGLPWGSIAALIGGSYFVWADRMRDEDLIKVLAEREAEFWQRIERQDPPPADASESSREILRKIYPKDTGEVVQLGPEAIDWHEQLVGAKARAKDAKTSVDTFENLLRQAIGDASAGVLPNGAVYTNKLQSRAGYSVGPCEFRVLRLKGGK